MLLAALLWTAAPVSAQVGTGVAAAKRLRQIQKQKQLKQARQAAAIERFLAMPADEREKALAQLPPVRRQQVEQRLQTLEQLSAGDRQMLLDRYSAFQSLPLRRQQAVRVALQRLRNMPEARRRAFLESSEARGRFDPDELQILRDASGLPDLE
jgi:Mg/Co/Ni transporter MgtE